MGGNGIPLILTNFIKEESINNLINNYISKLKNIDGLNINKELLRRILDEDIIKNINEDGIKDENELKKIISKKISESIYKIITNSKEFQIENIIISITEKINKIYGTQIDKKTRISIKRKTNK